MRKRHAPDRAALQLTCSVANLRDAAARRFGLRLAIAAHPGPFERVQLRFPGSLQTLSKITKFALSGPTKEIRRRTPGVAADVGEAWNQRDFKRGRRRVTRSAPVAYFMRMSLATEVTPLISRARTVALSMSARELTKPLS